MHSSHKRIDRYRYRSYRRFAKNVATQQLLHCLQTVQSTRTVWARIYYAYFQIISRTFVYCRWVSNFGLSKAALLFPVLIPESILRQRSVTQFSFACFIFLPISWWTSLYFCIPTGPYFLLFLRLLLMSHISRMWFTIHGFFFLLASPCNSCAVSMWMFSARLSMFSSKKLSAENLPKIVN